MSTLTLRTAGESHGPALTVLIEGFPADVTIDLDWINSELRRRQGGYGRGGRMRIERDEAVFLAGVRLGRTTGAPIVIQIVNRDSRLDTAPPLENPRPGHADLAGAIKWLTTDCRNALERASARETAGRVAGGALAACLLREFGIEVIGFVSAVGAVQGVIAETATTAELTAARDANEMYTPDAAAAEQMIAHVRKAKKAGDTVGGVVEARALGVPIGLGSCASWEQKLDGRLMRAVGSVQAIKGVEIGLGFEAARRPGSAVHDAIRFDAAQRGGPSFGFVRDTNRAGGLEGGMTNGMPVVVRAAMKPIATLVQGMDSVNLTTLAPQRSDYERSDVCAVPAASVVVQHVVGFEICAALREKFGGDTLGEMLAARDHYFAAVQRLGGGG
ncbi:MAG: chorismate synthase [Planctomycetia bacterium]|nr:MAG: chorismate synthase [Planctomycetia bacterium]